MRYLIEKGLAVLALLLLLGGQAGAQSGAVNSPVLTIDSEQLFVQSQFGQKFAQDFEARGKILEAENRRIEAELIAEEKELTERRATLPPAKFRSLADAFDEKVEQIRAEQNAKSRALAQSTETVRRQFLLAAGPVLEKILFESNAAVVVERRTVFLSVRAIDITDLAIARLNAEIGDGSDLAQQTTPNEDSE
ncbi:OmpH family outer membrane protein [Thalassobius sp. S69A]|uniref:OmpH family outer membrane protein n=1 Tax=unclassified Thalassovita TaxID=2619711 RepID=UPI000C56DF7F|nr:outer membrane chaperone Skp [Paracoccaceae bacterium]